LVSNRNLSVALIALAAAEAKPRDDVATSAPGAEARARAAVPYHPPRTELAASEAARRRWRAICKARLRRGLTGKWVSGVV
jgi:hypothetical protein